MYFSKALKLSNSTGRCSGGVVVLVKKCFLKSVVVTEISHDFHNIIALKLHNINTTSFKKDVILISSYVPPCSSPYYTFYHLTMVYIY